MQITGIVDKIYYYNYEGKGRSKHYAIVKIKSQSGEYKCMGNLPFPKPGEILTLEVEPRKDGGYEIKNYNFERKYTVNSLYKLLVQIDGVGQKTAKAICDAIQKHNPNFETTNITDFAKIIQVSNMSQKKKAKIVRELIKISELMKIFEILGDAVSFYDAVRIIERAKEQGDFERIINNPYCIIDYYPQLNIHRVDDYMLSYVNYDTTAEDRIAMYIKHVLYQQAANYSNYYMHKSDVMKKVTRRAKVQPSIVHQVMERMIDRGELRILDETGSEIELPFFYDYEERAANRLRMLLYTEVKPIKLNVVEEMLEKLEKKNNIELSKEQKQACIEAFEHKVMLITGGPGTGKSTIIKFIYTIAKLLGFTVKVLAPTGKAANRLSNLGGMTIHAAIGYNGIKARKYLEEDLVIVDESSMVDIEIFTYLLENVKDTARVVFVGDHNQLPPVGLGKPFEDLILSGKLPKVELKQVYRQRNESSIIINIAHAVINRDSKSFHYFLNEAKKLNVAFVHLLPSQDKVLSSIINFMIAGVKKYGLEALYNSVVLNPLNVSRYKNGRISTDPTTSVINQIIAEKIFKTRNMFQQGEKVVNTENNYQKEIFNGETGIVGAWQAETGQLYINFNGTNIPFAVWELSDIMRAYALSVHKSQGTEYPMVIIPILRSQFFYWDNRKLYTAITRAKNNLVFFGEFHDFEQTMSSIINKSVKYQQSRMIEIV